jgi:hypothetical protein
MADSSDVLIALYEEERAQARQSENQRTALTNLTLIIVGAGLAFIAADGIAPSDLVLSVPMIFVGAYGAVSSAKYFERWYRHWHRAAGYRSQLLELNPGIELKLREYSHSSAGHETYRYEVEATERFPRLSKVTTDRLWVAFHAGVILLGVALSVLALTI